MKKVKASVITIFVLITVSISACKTLGDITIGAGREHYANLEKIADAVVPLEAAGAAAAREKQTELLNARKLITEMENEASADAFYSAQLTAWSGRLAILEGRYSDAQRLHRQSSAASQGNFPSIILGIRLEGDPQKRLEIIEREAFLAGNHALSAGELNIEKGRALFELNLFAEAAGAFDAAFSVGLAPVYKENYSALRNRAWDFRNASGVAANTLGMLSQETVTWNDCIAIAKNETQLLRFLTGGRTLSDADLFTRLVDRGFIPYTQNITITNWPLSRPRADETVTRAGAAFFAWYLNAEARADRGLLSRYSARYATGPNPRSPIADVPPLSPFFDSILGCIEREFLSLPDGRNFYPAQPISGTEILAILKKIEG